MIYRSSGLAGGGLHTPTTAGKTTRRTWSASLLTRDLRADSGRYSRGVRARLLAPAPPLPCWTAGWCKFVGSRTGEGRAPRPKLRSGPDPAWTYRYQRNVVKQGDVPEELPGQRAGHDRQDRPMSLAAGHEPSPGPGLAPGAGQDVARAMAARLAESGEPPGGPKGQVR